ncbi:hypothetical protein EJ08DRAFT_666599 [Tothia fuscella]|uniref:Uncharacterized protein n=1 Tax=Tothia fuscella TaxID=1048955 RepID=A0A9P4NE64_9PEZI|nr:hypothetical protein EJ08DRAFT_666599 [Tothia fuscella]
MLAGSMTSSPLAPGPLSAQYLVPALTATTTTTDTPRSMLAARVHDIFESSMLPLRSTTQIFVLDLSCFKNDNFQVIAPTSSPLAFEFFSVTDNFVEIYMAANFGKRARDTWRGTAEKRGWEARLNMPV